MLFFHMWDSEACNPLRRGVLLWGPTQSNAGQDEEKKLNESRLGRRRRRRTICGSGEDEGRHEI